MDELQRLIQLEALSLALGVGIVVGISYELLEDVKLITFEPEISHLIMLMSLNLLIRSVSRQQALQMKNRLKVLRAERDWTQSKLAEELDVSRQTINAIETGKFDPSLPLAFKAARLFDMLIEDIFQDGVDS